MEPSKDMLVVTKDGRTVVQVPLAPMMTIGRGQGMSTQIEDAAMSRLHATVYTEGGRWFLVDKSTNGTVLDGQRLTKDQPAALRNGSVAALGDHKIQFVITSSVPAPAASAAARSESAAQVEEAEAPPPPSPLMDHLLDPRSRIPVWKEGEITLKVVDIIDEIAGGDCKTFRFQGKTPILFSFKPGQFVTFKLPIGGKTVKRSYSISSSPSRPYSLEITVKRVPAQNGFPPGVVSNWMCDNVKLGDEITMVGPSGKFSCFNFPSRKMLFIGAGSGITPVMSMLRWIVDTAADIDAYLFVSARTPREIIFRNEINWMTSRHAQIRVGVTLTNRWTGAESWTGLTGRCTPGMLKLLVPDINERHTFMCGPDPFMKAVKDCLRTIEYPIAQLHTESFGGPAVVRVAEGEKAQPREPVKVAVPVPAMPAAPAAAPAVAAMAAAPAAPPPVAAPAAAPAGFSIVFAKAGTKGTGNAGMALLDVAEANGVEIGYACRSGSCGSCKVKIVKGKCDHGEHSEISEDEKKEGYCYACVATPQSDMEILEVV